jgi:hypothetical protein
MTEVRDTVEAMLPPLVKIFMGGDKAVEFEPENEEDVASAEQETDYLNHVFFQDNPGFRIMYDALKDALVSKTGIFKCWVERQKVERQETYEGLTGMQILEMHNDSDIDFVAFTDRGDGTFDAVVRNKRELTKICAQAVPPEEFLISRRARSLDDARFVGHRVRKTATELIEMGFDPADVARLPSHDDQEFNEERLERFNNDEEWPEGGNDNDSGPSREIWITECFIHVDYDGDGIAELRHITVGGNDGAYVLLQNEEHDGDRPRFYEICPVPITHKFFGLSIADLLIDLQKIRSVIMRQMLDNAYLSNVPVVGVDENKVTDIDELLLRKPGGIVRTDGPPGDVLFPLQTPPLPPQTFGLMEFIDQVSEQRTGVSRYAQGLNPDSLNKTATGINLLQSAAQERIELIARIFAETGIREFFLGLHELVRKYQDVPRTVRIRNKWVHVDPRQWRERTDMKVRVGLGTGNREMQLLHLQGIEQAHAGAIQAQGGLEGPLVGIKEIYNLQREKAVLAGFATPELFWKDPEDQEAQPPQGPSPEQQAEMMKIQLDQEKLAIDKAKLQLEAQKLQLEAQKVAGELKTDADKIQFDYDKLRAELGDKEADRLDRRADTGATREFEDRKLFMANPEAAERLKSLEAQQEAGVAETMEQMARALNQTATTLQDAAEAMAAPKRVIRDKSTGQVVGVEPLPPAGHA